MPSPTRTSSSPRAINWETTRPTRSLSGTACGIFWLRAEPARSASASSRVVTAGKSWMELERIASTKTRGISFVISTRSACAYKHRRAIPSRLDTGQYRGVRCRRAVRNGRVAPKVMKETPFSREAHDVQPYRPGSIGNDGGTPRHLDLLPAPGRGPGDPPGSDPAQEPAFRSNRAPQGGPPVAGDQRAIVPGTKTCRRIERFGGASSTSSKGWQFFWR